MWCSFSHFERLLPGCFSRTSWRQFTGHALRELKKDGMTVQRAYMVLRGGVVREAEWEHGEWRHQVQAGVDVLVLTFETETNAVVITGWKRRR